MDVLKVLVDLSGIEEANNERNATTYYGGTWRVGEKEGNGWGDDRSDNHLGDVRDEIVRLCKEKWPAENFFEDDDFLSHADDVLNEGVGGNRFIFVVENEGGGAYRLDSEETEEDAAAADAAVAAERARLKKEAVDRLTKSLHEKIPYVSPQLLESKLAEYVGMAFDLGYEAAQKEMP